MLGGLAQKIFGSANDRFVAKLSKTVDQINALEPSLEALSEYDLKAKTQEFRDRLKNGETLDQILPEAFAVVREASKRCLGLRHFDVQLMGGMVLHKGRIAEMNTGEGKTLVATLPVYLNALEGKGVHVVTVNDYLAKRDSDWMGQLYNYLGLTTSCIIHGLTDAERKIAYAADVTYGTNNEFGFDYLRDNMKFSLEDMAQREFNFAIVDEVDSILIDEARTPLIISGPAQDSSEMYINVNKVIPFLKEQDYELDEKQKSCTLTELGTENAEALLREHGLITQGGLYDMVNMSLVHHLNSALKAHKLFKRDKDYIVKDNKVVIIDEFTGRMMEGRRYSEGLHQALEAKEGVDINRENQTLASVTFQNYFRLYPKLAGMTGTAMTEEHEFVEIYGLEVTNIPTNVPSKRIDEDDEIYRTSKEKNNAILELIKEVTATKQPVLVGTVSIEKSDELSQLLKKNGVKHSVLNARFHEQEAQIIAQAGRPGAVTIATNMAGRGTDIQLGGNYEMMLADEAAKISDEKALKKRAAELKAQCQKDHDIVLEAGGLYVIGTERHESRRIDNQLRGRSARQGDPGHTKFFLSLEDDLMRIFGQSSINLDSMMQKMGLKEGEPITHRWMNKALEKAQQKVESHNFDIRKNLLKFDNVMNDQRTVIYEQRRDLMEAEDVHETVTEMRHDTIQNIVAQAIPKGTYADQWDVKFLHEEVLRVFGEDLPILEWAREDGIADIEIEERLMKMADEKMAKKVADYGKDVMRNAEKSILLQLLDQIWKEHLLALDQLRQGISLRAYAQRDPLNEYKAEAFSMFEEMLDELRERVTRVLAHIEIRVAQPEMPQSPSQSEMQMGRQDPATQQNEPAKAAPKQAFSQKVPRNAPCPCGSGKKYKHCHGKVGATA